MKTIKKRPELKTKNQNSRLDWLRRNAVDIKQVQEEI